jgi:sulfur transfer protein SufE
MHFQIKFATELAAAHGTRGGAEVHREMLFQRIDMSETLMAHRARGFTQMGRKMAHARTFV